MAFNFSFKNLLSSFSLSEKTSSSVVGIDIGSSAIKVVQLKRKGGRAILETYGALALGPYMGTEMGRATNAPTEKLIEAIKDLFREANVTSRNAGLAIPLSSSLVSVVEMPALPENRMAEMVPIEARRYIPVPIAEVALDWWVIPREEKIFTNLPDQAKEAQNEKKVDVLLVAILNEAITRYQQIAKNVPLDHTIFEIELFGSVRSVLEEGIEPSMVFDLGAGSTKLYLVEHGIVKDSHIVNRGSQDITLALSRSLNISVKEAEEMKRNIGLSKDPAHRNVSDSINLTLDYIFGEANRVLLAFEKKYNKTVSKVVLTGGGSVMKGFRDLAQLRLNTKVVTADPFSKTVTPAFLEGVLTDVGPEFAVAVGVALRKLSTVD
jgi:type IV pilus assembly protein PilM